MTTAGRRAAMNAEPAVSILETPRRPPWVDALLASAGAAVSPSNRDTEVKVEVGGGFLFARWRAASVRRLDAAGFGHSVEEGYRALLQDLLERGVVPVRFWNYIPGITEEPGTDHDRYALFNIARTAAIEAFWDGIDRHELPAASAVGSPVDELVIEVLASKSPPRALENPRQTPAYHYSDRYGPVPPFFSRAVLLGTPARVDGEEVSAILSGTASIVGEDTAHAGDIEAQLGEIAANLEAIALSLRSELRRGIPRHSGGAAPEESALGYFRNVRMYATPGAEVGPLLDWFRNRFHHLSGLELMRVDLCRRDLVAELEATLCFPG